jgi:predicted HTH domain antitoxin
MSSSASKNLEFRVQLPNESVNDEPEAVIARLRLLWLLDLVRQGRMSSGRAAEIIEVPRAKMFEIMTANGVPVINYGPDELADELEAAARAFGQTR